MRARIAALVSLLLLVFTPASRGEELYAGVTEEVISITSNFTGQELVVFGTIAEASPADAAKRDVIVILRGPRSNVVVRKKEQMGVIWVNREKAQFEGVPGFYFVASVRPLSQIASKPVLERSEIGLDNLRILALTDEDTGQIDEFRHAIVKEMEEKGLYTEVSGEHALNFIGPHLFSVKIALPASVPVGIYRIDAIMLNEGNVVGAYSWPLEVDKFGIERWLFDLAHDEPAIYGVWMVLISIFFGWASSMFFRRPA